MQLAHVQRTTRRGFTLVELLVVIAIIAVLLSLLLPAVMKYIGWGPVAQCANDISQLDVAIQRFCTDYKVQYIPSQIKICKRYSSYGTTQLDKDSIAYLTSVFPGLVRPSPTMSVWNTVGIDWDGTGVGSNTVVTLQGDQCLVFFLGGIPTSSGGVFGVTGFANNQSNPANGTGTRNKPSYEFDSSRLYVRGTGGYLSYSDPHNSKSTTLKKPYAYFSSYNVRNGYNRYGTSDCASLGVYPYQEAAGRFLKPSSYQIIAAGPDGMFGPGTVPGAGAYYWNRNTAAAIPVNGADDQSNFSGQRLGVPN
jgi:prepilin-type N-terminal cleavage/methylation domain-containing protein